MALLIKCTNCDGKGCLSCDYKGSVIQYDRILVEGTGYPTIDPGLVSNSYEGYRQICDAPPAQVTRPCPACEAAARELAAIRHALDDDRVDLVMSAAEAVTELRRQLDEAEETNRTLQMRIQRLVASPCSDCDALQRHCDEADAELDGLRAGILRVIEDYPRAIKQDAEEALRALLADGSRAGDLRARLAAVADEWEAPRAKYTEAQGAHAAAKVECASQLRAIMEDK